MTTPDIYLAKKVFRLHGLDANGKTELKKQFKSPDGNNLHISGSIDTSRPGVCKLFGFSGSVPNGERYTGSVFSSEIVISQNGKFFRFDDSQRHYGIASLICTK